MKENYYELLEDGRNKVPFGIIRCSDEKYPKVTFVNKVVRAKVQKYGLEKDVTEYIKENIFLMLPFDERDRFRSFLENASEEPSFIQHKVYCGSKIEKTVSGWIYKEEIETEAGEIKKEYVIVYTPTLCHVENYNEQRENSYLDALKSAFQLIFDIDLEANTVECIYGKETSPIGSVGDIMMTIPSAKEFWLNNYIIPEHYDMVKEYFDKIAEPGELVKGGRPLQVESALLLESGDYYKFLGTAVALDSTNILFCVRNIGDVKYADRSETGVWEEKKLADIRTFGYFDIFVDNRPVRFTNPKEKELLAILVDRKGGTVAASDAITLLYEDEKVDEKLKAKYRKLAMGLKQTLTKYGIEEILINDSGVRHLDTSKVNCDYYKLLEGDATARKAFADAYMVNYSWAEETLAALLVATT